MLVIMQQLSISFGVSAASLVLSFFGSEHLGFSIAQSFHYTFIVLAIITILSSVTFRRLSDSDGRGYM
ncbi:MFS transporter, partial [Flavobacterium sp. 3-210]